MRRIILAASATALLIGAMPAAAQECDNLPGSAWSACQIGEQGLNPNQHLIRTGYHVRTGHGAYAYGKPRARARYYRERGDIRYQDRKLREMFGYPPR